MSARNVLAAHIVRLQNVSDLVYAQVALDEAPQNGGHLEVVLTKQSVREMQLEEGTPVVAIFKASALRPLALGLSR